MVLWVIGQLEALPPIPRYRPVHGPGHGRLLAEEGDTEPSQFTSISELIKWTKGQQTLANTGRDFKLTGQTFKFRPVDGQPFLYPYENGIATSEWSSRTGLALEMLSEIAAEAEFEIQLVSNDTDVGRSGGLKDVSTGIADATIGPVSVSTTSFPVQFSTAWMDTGLVLVVYQEDQKSSLGADVGQLYAWMLPFTWEVWGTIVAIIVTYGLLMFWIERDDTASVDFDPPEEQGARGVFKSIYLSSVTFIGQIAGHFPGSVVGRVFMQTTAFVAVIIASSYTANLATFLTASRQATIATLSSIHDAQAAGSRICVDPSSTSAVSVLSTDYKRIVQVPANGTTKEAVINDGIAKMEAKKCAGMIMDEIHARTTIASRSNPCTLRIAGSVFTQLTYGIAVRKVGKASDEYERLNALKNSIDYHIMKVPGRASGCGHQPSGKGINQLHYPSLHTFQSVSRDRE